jgi:hypothetical protein
VSTFRPLFPSPGLPGLALLRLPPNIHILPKLDQSFEDQKHGADNSNSALYWAAQIFGGLAIPLICDLPPLPIRTRAILAWSCLFVFGNMTMMAGASFEKTRQGHDTAWRVFGGEGYWGGAGLYFSYGVLDALWQGVSVVFPFPSCTLCKARGTTSILQSRMWPL